MSDRNGFTGGFLAGAVVGGIVGGMLGAWLTSRRNKNLSEEETSLLESETRTEINFSTEENMEIARRNLEDKIAQLNSAIDDVRQQLGNVNGNGSDFETD
jgi:Na+/glutamate symporter